MAIDPEQVSQRVRELVMAQLEVTAAQLTREACLVKDLGAEELDLLDIEVDVEIAFALDDPLYADDEPMFPTLGDLIDRTVAALRRREDAAAAKELR